MDNIITTVLLPIVRNLNIILIFIVSAAWIYCYIRTREPGLIAPVTWLVNALAFYIFRFIVLKHSTPIDIDVINLWSSIVITHGAILLLLTAWVVKINIGNFLKRRQDKDL